MRFHATQSHSFRGNDGRRRPFDPATGK
jgi:hypothetical protein